MTADLVLTIDADHFDDIAGFYIEVNRVFMATEDWRLGESLDGFDDLLYGGYGATKGHARIDLHWRGMEKSRHDLGIRATERWLEKKLQPQTGFDPDRIRRQLAKLRAGQGQTYFQILQEIIESHPRIRLIPA